MIHPVGAIIQFEGDKKSPLVIGAHYIFWPETWYYHVAILGEYIEDENDYEIVESIGSGVRLGRLSFYNGRTYRILWPSGAQLEDGKKAWRKASKFGRRRYDFKFYFKLPFRLCWMQAVNLFKYRSFFKVTATQLGAEKGQGMVCTKFGSYVWRQVDENYPFPSYWAEIPASFEAAIKMRFLIVLGEHIVKNVGFRNFISTKIFRRSSKRS